MSRCTIKVWATLLVALLTASLFSACRSAGQTAVEPVVSESGETAVAPTVVAPTAAVPTAVAATPADAAFSCDNVSEIPVAECQALITFYEVTGGLFWNDNSGWLNTNTPCSWAGVTCAGEHIDSLNIFFNNLAGPLPAALANLTRLRVLDLHNNALTGAIPPELGGLSNLEYLDLSVNQMNGPIPAALGDLPALQALALPYNRLGGPLPAELGQIATLRSLDLSYNQIDGEIPASFADLAALETVRLRDNQLSGAIPFGLGALPALTEIDLSFNQLSGAVPSALYEAPIHRFWGNQLDGAILVAEPQTEVSFLGASFTVDSALAGSVWPELMPARAPEPGPGGLWAPSQHIVFTFAPAGGPANHSPLGLYLPPEAQIHIYPTAGLNAEVQPVVAALQQLLADPSQLDAYESAIDEMGTQPSLPLLPPSNAAQTVRAQVEIIQFAEGSGVRYLTHLSQGPMPISNQDLFYTFQGVTADGATYVAAFFPVSLPDLPDSPQVSEDALNRMMEDWQGYLAQTLALLNEQPAAAFTPDLALLDGLINSLSVAGTTAVPTLEGTWPDDGEAVDAQPILQWTAVPDAARYEVVVVDDDAYPPVVAFSQTTEETAVAVTPALAPGSYSWTVRALDANDAVVAELNRQFWVKAALEALSPALGETVTATPTLTWQAYPEATGYHVVILDEAAYPPAVVVDAQTSEPSFVVTTPLAPGSYSWTVWALDGTGKVAAEVDGRFVVADAP